MRRAWALTSVAEVEVGLAPSSVTKTSPCWKGDMVPGSTLRAGVELHEVDAETARLKQAADRGCCGLPADSACYKDVLCRHVRDLFIKILVQGGHG